MALDHGISPFDFWEMSVIEIIDCINSAKRKQIQKAKWDVWCNFFLAQKIVEEIALGLDERHELTPRMPWDYFPTLFVDEKQTHDKSKEVEMLEKVKADRRAFAKRLNERFRKE